MANRIGRYELAELLGEGAFGQFFRGHDPATGRDVAVQVVRFDPKTPPAARELAIADLKAANALSHPSVSTIYDVVFDGDSVAVVRELVEGRSLAEHASESAPFRPVAVVAWLDQIADALDYAHSRGVVHGDLGPALVLISDTGRVKVTGFGATKVAGRTTAALGLTADYMSPEKIRGESATAASDQYALGSIVYELVSGGAPFASDSPITTAFKAANEAPPTIAGIAPELSSDVDAIVRRALAKSPTDRYPTCRAFVDAFRLAATASAEIAGAAAAVNDSDGIVSAIFCDQCGAALRPGVKFCYKCGSATVAHDEPEPVVETVALGSEPAAAPEVEQPPLDVVTPPAPVVTAAAPRPETSVMETPVVPPAYAAVVEPYDEPEVATVPAEAPAARVVPTYDEPVVERHMAPPLAGYAASTHAGELPPPGADLGGKPKSGIMSGALPVVLILLVILFLFGLFGFMMAPRMLAPQKVPVPAQTSAVASTPRGSTSSVAWTAL